MTVNLSALDVVKARVVGQIDALAEALVDVWGRRLGLPLRRHALAAE
ncbi:hypothetical protein [Bradyrhizobium acaciae]|nr:hypothetical protein [Bradyrhizobium acaciae]MCC8977359.1 hypothetical protein [Bradyrhizobium acaciae]